VNSRLLKIPSMLFVGQGSVGQLNKPSKLRRAPFRNVSILFVNEGDCARRLMVSFCK